MRTTIVVSLLLIAAVTTIGCKDDKKDGATTPGASPTAVTPVPTVPNTPPPEIDITPTVTDSGLQIFDIVVGSGEVATAQDVVGVHYTGWLEDGTKFDSSYDRGQPVAFGLDQVIEGWQEGIPGMKVGGKRRLIVPSDIAYGDAGRPPIIPGKATLTFDVELIALNP